jgi:hypothetical protein
MSNARFCARLAALLLFAAPILSSAQHIHVNAGAVSLDPGSQLDFFNGSRYVTNSGYDVSCRFATNGTYAGYYFNEGLTFTALPGTLLNGGPAVGRAAFGAHLVLRVVSVDGPAGGSFGFWESPGDDLDAEALTFSVPVGEHAGTQEIPLSQNNGEPGADPYGHIHGRIYTTTLPGLYIVGFQIRDTSTNGPGGGPIHVPSDLYPMYFQAGVTITSVALTAAGCQISFPTDSNINSGVSYLVEGTADLANPASWQRVGDPILADDHFHTVTLPVTATAAFFRLRVE